jgi:hypothetical protein
MVCLVEKGFLTDLSIKMQREILKWLQRISGNVARLR